MKFTDNTEIFKAALDKAKLKGLEEIGLQAEKYAKGPCHVKTGLLRNSITYAISGQPPAITSYHADPGMGDGHGEYKSNAPDDKNKSVYIGTNVEYAQFVENRFPFLRPAATEHTAEYRRMLEEVLRNA